MQFEFLVLQGLMQPGQRLNPRDIQLILLRVEQVHPFAARLLGLEHGLAGVTQQGFGVGVVEGEHGDAQAGGKGKFPAIDLAGGLGHGHDPVGQRVHFVHVGQVADDQSELVSTQPGHAGVFGRGLAQVLGHPDQQQVAGGAAVMVIDQLEAIQVQANHRQQPVFLAGLFAGLVQVVSQGLVLGQAGERVEMADKLELLTGQSRSRQVAIEAHIAHQLAGIRTVGMDAQMVLADIAVAAAIPDFAFPLACLVQAFPDPRKEGRIMLGRMEHV